MWHFGIEVFIFAEESFERKFTDMHDAEAQRTAQIRVLFSTPSREGRPLYATREVGRG